jgi:8-oxo-dGTP diphosphatase
VSDPFVVYVCVALYRDRRWLLTVRGTKAAHAPDVIGLVGGHLESAPAGEESEPALLEERVLENNARREVLEETGVDLAGIELSYLGSELFRTDAGPAALAVTFVAEVPAGVEPVLAAPDELDAVGWWTVAELEQDPRCPPWTLRLVRQASGLRR